MIFFVAGVRSRGNPIVPPEITPAAEALPIIRVQDSASSVMSDEPSRDDEWMVGDLHGVRSDPAELGGPAASWLDWMQSRPRGREPDAKTDQTNRASPRHNPELGCNRDRRARIEMRKSTKRTWFLTAKPVDLDAIRARGRDRIREIDQTNLGFPCNIPGLGAMGLPYWRGNE